MPRSGLVFLDLDDNIFASKRKSHGANLKPVAFRTNGEPVCFMDEHQQAFFHWLTNSGVRIIPTTARTSEQFARVRLPFDSDYTILAHGAVIRTPDGNIDKQWHEQIQDQAQSIKDEWHLIRQWLTSCPERNKRDVTVTLVQDAELDLYLQFKHRQKDAEQMKEFASYAEATLQVGGKWQVLSNDNNMYILPHFLGKEKAVSYLCQQLADEVSFVIGSGDSLSDVPFMSNCAYALMPTQSQAFDHLHKGGKS